MPKAIKPQLHARRDAEHWAVESDVSIATMLRVLRGEIPNGRASQRAWRYLAEKDLLAFIAPVVAS